MDGGEGLFDRIGRIVGADRRGFVSCSFLFGWIINLLPVRAILTITRNPRYAHRLVKPQEMSLKLKQVIEAIGSGDAIRIAEQISSREEVNWSQGACFVFSVIANDERCGLKPRQLLPILDQK